MSKKVMPSGYTSQAQPVARTRSALAKAVQNRAKAVLQTHMDSVPMAVDVCREVVQLYLETEEGKRVTNDEALALVRQFEAEWHPGGVPAEFTE